MTPQALFLGLEDYLIDGCVYLLKFAWELGRVHSCGFDREIVSGTSQVPLQSKVVYCFAHHNRSIILSLSLDLIIESICIAIWIELQIIATLYCSRLAQARMPTNRVRPTFAPITFGKIYAQRNSAAQKFILKTQSTVTFGTQC